MDGFGADPRRVEMAGGKTYSDFQKDKIGARFEELGFTYSAPEDEKVIPDSTMDSEEPENLVFFYHPDHLGSTSYVTDADGNIAQHVEYIPYGEIFVEERNSQFSTNFLFNAKELDNETGLYYYGARYLDPTGAMWLSVDPMWEKYVDATPYNYCHGNPMKMIDPDGMEEKENKQYEKRKTLSETETGLGSYNNAVGAGLNGASAEPTKHINSKADIDAVNTNKKNAKTGSGITAKSSMQKGGAKYYTMSSDASKTVRTVGKGTKALGILSTGITIISGLKDLYDTCNSNLSTDDKILNSSTIIFSTAGSVEGAYYGTAVGFAAGSETGPGALVTAAIGGYLGAEVGEKAGYGIGYLVGKGIIFIKHKITE